MYDESYRGIFSAVVLAIGILSIPEESVGVGFPYIPYIPGR
jgi:hypothetical protein